MAARGLMVLLMASTYDGLWRVQAQCSNATAMAARVDALLAEYPRGVRPEGDGGDGGHGGPLVVTLGLSVRHASVDDRASSVRLIADLTLSWVDSRLRWNASEWGCDVVLVEAERLWLPDVELVSAGAAGAAGAGAAARQLRARLDRGRVLWARRLDLSAPVPLDLTHWPRDTQTAVFKFASRQYTIDEIDLAFADMKYSTVFEAGAWETASLSAGQVVASAGGGGGGDRRVVAWALSLRRRGAVRGAAAGAVLAVAALLLVAAALQPPHQRDTLAAAASLIASIWLLSVSEVLKVAGSAPRVVLAGGGAAALGAALAGAAGAARRLRRSPRPPPRPLRLALQAVATVCTLTLDEPGDSSAGGGSGTWRAAAVLLDRVLLTCGALCLLVLYAMAL